MFQEFLLNTGRQWVAFLIIPTILYLIFFRNKTNFLSFLGLKRRSKKVESNLLVKTIVLSVFYLIFNIYIMKNFDVGSSDIRFISFQQTGLSIVTILILFINSIIQTSLLEEIVFRGFLINALSYKLGFRISNHIQSFAFTGIHVAGTIQMGLSLPVILLGNICIYILSIYWGKLIKESGYSIYYPALFHGIINLMIGIFLFLSI